VVNHNILDIG